MVVLDETGKKIGPAEWQAHQGGSHRKRVRCATAFDIYSDKRLFVNEKLFANAHAPREGVEQGMKVDAAGATIRRKRPPQK